MVRRVDPLDKAPPIVGPDGRPAPLFIRQWQNLIALVQSVSATVSRAVNTVGGLQGGGTLAGDLTLSLTDTGVTPGTFRGIYTVDAKGRLTSATDVTRRNGPFVFATLPATPAQGDTAFITDAAAPAFLAAAGGGGAVVAPVMYNGAAWVYG